MNALITCTVVTDNCVVCSSPACKLIKARTLDMMMCRHPREECDVLLGYGTFLMTHEQVAVGSFTTLKSRLGCALTIAADHDINNEAVCFCSRLRCIDTDLKQKKNIFSGQ